MKNILLYLLLFLGMMSIPAQAEQDLQQPRFCIGFSGTPKNMEERKAGPYDVTCYQDGLEIFQEQNIFAACRFSSTSKNWDFSGFFLTKQNDILLYHIGRNTSCRIIKKATN